jgi:nucleotidyltransferase substrate binding protein (TIGR01987 family)
MEQEVRWRQRLEDFESALLKLSEGLEKNTFSELEKDGVIQRFEFTFELAWKTLKDYLEDQGIIDVPSPKKALKKAFQENLIVDGDLWLQMLEDRNSLSHLYKQEMSEKIFEHIKQNYVQALQDLALKFKKE